ncbi:hypothetical protein TNCT_416751 [Trichonephila clavata]|uniref:Uncharacterized protein n=1 Tax=Trichonephila clavata TaxID=2740835 RepID=A0A8X6G4R1_TRICU|nr:hypothetical protein TNCT_416751 [Trichonephila clavata]
MIENYFTQIWDKIGNAFKPATRASIAVLKNDFMNIRLYDDESMFLLIMDSLSAKESRDSRSKCTPKGSNACVSACIKLTFPM